MPGRVITNGHVRDLIPYAELPEYARVRFAHVAEAAGIDPVTAEAPEGQESTGEEWAPRFVRYRDAWWDVSDAERIESRTNPPGMRAPFAFTVDQGDPLAQWEGIVTQSHWDGIVFRWGTDWDGRTDTETIVCGYWVAD